MIGSGLTGMTVNITMVSNVLMCDSYEQYTRFDGKIAIAWWVGV